ncbi:SURF1 family cytochrome oxidase biogenesis protein [Dactylosporangium matsuzakiense]|uniref:SURF1 family cytochrome oxidase biogenesis protein n=1 Tax=Dactylosporangium matsuzakiense TaxID=53360 RepID=UPI0021C2E339|nr:SURF1 family protein [Dactylosporangium matsuzakiense]UWZ43758.1 SURF1 family protein [Dactylosporangium matsuzakiense]
MYRFLATPRWLGYAALTLAAATVMVLLGLWQLDRYHQRAEINARISAGTAATPVPLTAVVGAPSGAAGTVGPAPAEHSEWTRVTVTGRFDPAHEILVRGRTVEGAVGFEVLTPLVLPDGTAVLVDRGWVRPAAAGALTTPDVPAAPDGSVTVSGRLVPAESRGGRPQQVAGHAEIRRITPTEIAPGLPYAIFDAYVSADQPAPGLVAVPAEKQNALQNAGYVLQWWLFAAMTIYGFGYLARREARGPRPDNLLDDEDDDAHAEEDDAHADDGDTRAEAAEQLHDTPR